jgi:hypothetical protein
VSTMAEVGETENPSMQRRSFPDMKKAAQKSAEGTRKAIQATIDLPVAAAKATKGARDSLRGSATAVAKAIKFKQREEIVDNELASPSVAEAIKFKQREEVVDDEPASPLMGTERNDSEEISPVSPSCDSTAPPIDNIVLNFLTADATIIMSASFSVVLAITLLSWSAILDNQVPLSVAGIWVVFAFGLVRVFSVPKVKTSHRVLSPSRESSSVSDSSSTHWIKEKKEKTDTHRFFRKTFGRQQQHIKVKGAPESAPKSRASWINSQTIRERHGNLMQSLLMNKNRDPDIALAKKFGETDWE